MGNEIENILGFTTQDVLDAVVAGDIGRIEELQAKAADAFADTKFAADRFVSMAKNVFYGEFGVLAGKRNLNSISWRESFFVEVGKIFTMLGTEGPEGPYDPEFHE